MDDHIASDLLRSNMYPCILTLYLPLGLTFTCFPFNVTLILFTSSPYPLYTYHHTPLPVHRCTFTLIPLTLYPYLLPLQFTVYPYSYTLTFYPHTLTLSP